MADNFASSEIEDVSYAIMDVQSQIVRAASVLAAQIVAKPPAKVARNAGCTPWAG
jgi:hypothetical protein